jgi:protein-S-isoprenylcysteine O-methyltransferase Ste14
VDISAADRRGPDVRVPPPLFFVAGWVVGWGLDRRIGFAIDAAGSSALQLALGGLFVAGGLAVMGWALSTFLKAGTAVLPVRPARLLVTTGPFRRTRNPMYLGLTAVYFGLALLANFAWPIVLLPVVLVALSSVVIEREERYLARAFGAEYERYRSNVRRWL